MTEPAQSPRGRAWHVGALLAGVGALVVFYAIPGGIGGYAWMILAGIIAAVIGHAAVRRRGTMRWAAIVGLVLAYLELIVAVGLLVVGLTRTFTH